MSTLFGKKIENFFMRTFVRKKLEMVYIIKLFSPRKRARRRKNDPPGVCPWEELFRSYKILNHSGFEPVHSTYSVNRLLGAGRQTSFHCREQPLTIIHLHFNSLSAPWASCESYLLPLQRWCLRRDLNPQPTD